MVKYVNCGLYNVNLEGDTSAEFDGEHPTLIVRTKVEKTMYIAIPFTTYTSERWLKLKDGMCCRVKSTNSIARIDKIEIINQNKIKNRWKDNENNKVLSPSKEDIEFVLNKAREYFIASINEGLSDSLSFKKEIDLLQKEIDEVIVNENLDKAKKLIISFDDNQMCISFKMNLIYKLSSIDLYELFNKIFNRKNYRIEINNDLKLINVNVLNNDKKVLTIKQKYDKLNIAEG